MSRDEERLSRLGDNLTIPALPAVERFVNSKIVLKRNPEGEPKLSGFRFSGFIRGGRVPYSYEVEEIYDDTNKRCGSDVKSPK